MVSSATASLSTLGVLVTRILRGLGGLGVDVVVADAEIGDDFELGQLVHQVGIDAPPAMARTRGATFGDQRILVGRFVQLVDGVALGQGRLAAVEQLVGLEDFDGIGLLTCMAALRRRPSKSTSEPSLTLDDQGQALKQARGNPACVERPAEYADGA